MNPNSGDVALHKQSIIILGKRGREEISLREKEKERMTDSRWNRVKKCTQLLTVV